MTAHATTAMDTQIPDVIIVFGALRAGTTMLRLMVNGHPDLACIGENDYLIDHLSRDPNGTLQMDRAALAETRIFRGSGLRVPPENLDGVQAVYDLVRQIATREGKRPVLMVHRRMALCAELFPDAPILRYIRDPRDVARSAIGMGWAGNVYYGADPWLHTEKSWQDFRQTANGHKIMQLRFEDLVEQPAKKLSELCNFVGVAYDPAMLAYPETTTYSAPDAKLANQWKTKLSEDQIGLVEARLGDVLSSSGYAPSGIAVVQPGFLRRIQLAVQNRSAIWTSMIKRFGIVDPVLRGIGRRLKIDPLTLWATRRMDEKIKAFLK